MSSKRWTIVCLTLILLIFGCTDSEVAKVKGTSQPDGVGTAAASTRRSASDSIPAPALPPVPGFHAMTDGPGHFPGLGHGGSLIDPKGMLGLGRNGARPGLPPKLAGFEGGPSAERLRRPQPEAIPLQPKTTAKLGPRFSLEDHD